VRLCFIVERRYRRDGMPRLVADQLKRWGHHVDLLEPQAAVTCLTELFPDRQEPYDAWVLKTVSDGPGISILEAAAATGAVTINDPRAIRLVRDKAVAAAYARVHGLPFPHTYFVTDVGLLSQIPSSEYPLVVKPSNGSQGRAVQLIRTPADLDRLDLDGAGECFLLAQRYEPNGGYDVKLYNTGRGIWAVERPSLLGGPTTVPDRIVPLTQDLHDLAVEAGRIFGLDIYGIDVVSTARGWVAVDVNDFPSFGQIPDAEAVVAQSILDIVGRRSEAAALRGGRGQRPVPAPAAPVIRLSAVSQRHRTAAMRIALISDRPEHPVLGEMVEVLGRRHRVTVVDPHPGDGAGAVAARECRAPADVYLLKSHTAEALELARALELRGATVVNSWASTLACQDRVLMARRLARAGLPHPRTWELPSLGRARRVPPGAAYPLIVKSRFSRRGDLVTRVDGPDELEALMPRWGSESVILQEYTPNDGWDIKLWVIGGAAFAARRRTPLDPAFTRDSVPIPEGELSLSPDWVAATLRVGGEFALSLYGVDLLVTASGPAIVDVNAFPGYRGVPGAAAALAAFTEGLSMEVSDTA
jgi:ribosomal protein S6--L-glutamate ligase